MRIERHIVDTLPVSLQRELQKRVDREFGDVPIVREHMWSKPTWAFLGYVHEQLVSSLNIVDRHVLADDADVHFFGVNNVITEPQHRSHGYSKLLNQAAIQFMADTDTKGYGFLFCADELIPFYTSLGWTKFTGEVTVAQPSGEKRWSSNAMIYDPNGQGRWRQVHLCGLPW